MFNVMFKCHDGLQRLFHIHRYCGNIMIVFNAMFILNVYDGIDIPLTYT